MAGLQSRNIVQMDYRIEGELAQVAHLELLQGEACWASKGSILQIDTDLHWHLKVPGDIAAVGSRMLSGEGIAMTHFVGTRTGQKVSLTANQPGKIIPQQGGIVGGVGQALSIAIPITEQGAAFNQAAGDQVLAKLAQTSGDSSAEIQAATSSTLPAQ